MRYIGGLTGLGTLKNEGETIVRVSYDLECFFRVPVGITGSGEILLPSPTFKSLLGVNGVQLLTDDGKLLDLKFSARDLTSQGDILHVDIAGGLPVTPADWMHHSISSEAPVPDLATKDKAQRTPRSDVAGPFKDHQPLRISPWR